MLRSGQRRRGPWLAAAIALILLVASAAVGHAQQAESGTITVRLVMGTEGETIEGAPTVQVVAYRDGQEQETREATPDGEHRYRLTNLPTGAGYDYVPFVAYKGVVYVAPRITLAGTGPAAATITVYEPTEDQSVLRVVHDIVIITGVNAPDKRLSISEAVVFDNRSDRSYLPSTTGAAGPMGLLRFGLPPGARDLQPLGPLAAYEIAAVDLGFATTMPVQPGRTMVSFRYLVDYGGLRGTAFQYEKSLPYATDRVAVLVGDPRLDIASSALRDAGTVTSGGQTYRQYDSVATPVAGPLLMAIEGLPGMFPFDPSGPAVRYAGLALAIALAGAVALLSGRLGSPLGRSRAGRALTDAGEARGQPAVAPGAVLEELLLRETARLDIAFEEGRVPEDVYRRERAALTHRLVESGRRAPAAPTVAGEKKGADDGRIGYAAGG